MIIKKTSLKNTARIVLALSASLCALGVSAATDKWPTQKAIEVIVPYTPGGSTDTLARLVMKELEERLGQTIVIQNRPGASGTLGESAAIRSKPDGYTFVMVLASHAVNPFLHKLNYDPKDLVPVSLIADLPLFIFVNNSLPVESFSELITYAKKNPNTLNYASSGVGAVAHLLTENIALDNDLKMTHVPYKGSAPILTDLLSGDISFAFDTVLVFMPYAKEGKLKAFAVTTPERWEDTPDIPTFKEEGYPEYAVSSWAGLMAPKGTPQAIIDKMSAEISDIVKDKSIQKQFKNAGFVPVGSTPAEFAKIITENSIRFGDVIKKANISIN